MEIQDRTYLQLGAISQITKAKLAWVLLSHGTSSWQMYERILVLTYSNYIDFFWNSTYFVTFIEYALDIRSEHRL